MSTAVFPLGMESYNNTSFGTRGTNAYSTWKGTGRYQFPVGVTAGNIRPLTNKDYSNPENDARQKHGLPRPLKWQHRKGKTTQNANDLLINRQDKSSRTSSLIGQMIDRPGQFIVKQNASTEEEAIVEDSSCLPCNGVGIVASFKPETYLTNNPEPSVTTPPLCCNEQRKALRRVLPANTNLPKNYFTTLQQYRQNRCQTYDQRVFNFQTGSDMLSNSGIAPELLKYSKPGDPLSSLNLYVANCYPNADSSTNLRGCKQVYYKPNNPQFAQQGGVSSSTRLLKLTVDTISKNLASTRKLKGSGGVPNIGGQPNTPFIYKNKVQKANCNSLPYFRREKLVQNRTICFPPENNYIYKDLNKLGNIGGNFNGTFVGDQDMIGAR